MLYSIFRVTIIFLAFTISSVAQDASWTTPLNDTSAQICNDYDLCTQLTCGVDGQLNLTFSGMPGGMGQLYVDGRQIGRGEWALINGVASIGIDPNRDGLVLDAMRAGSRMEIQIGGRVATYGLRGSNHAIDVLLDICSPDLRLPSELAASADYLRFPDELGMTAPGTENPFGAFVRRADTDLPGGDIRNGLDDSLLSGITEESCAAICQLTEGCGAYTWNGRDGDICFLKSGQRGVARYAGAISGVLNTTPSRLPPPPTRGPLPVTDESVRWRVGDTPSVYASRVRAAAAPLAGSCEAERVDLVALARAMSFTVPSSAPRVGEVISLQWRGNELTERIPVWFMASTPAQVRFDGDGFFALGPDAPNPFGIEAGSGEVRALVSLWARGSGSSGVIGVKPLRAGSLPITMQLVAYLRACGEEVVLKEESVTLSVSPASAELIVGTPVSRSDLTHVFDIEKLNRRVELSDQRIRISALSDGTEIVERAGTQTALSPTQRFLTINHNQATEIVDLIDGEVVGRIAAGAGWWAIGDSFFVGTTAPWARAWIVSTFAGRPVLLSDVNPGVGTLTGPACCYIDPSSTHLSIDLENGIASVRGTLGSAIVPLQSGSWVLRDEPNDGYSANYISTPGLTVAGLASIGTVAPTIYSIGFSAPGGFEVAAVQEGLWGGSAEGNSIFERFASLPDDVQPRPIMQVARASIQTSDVIFQLERLGVLIAPSDPGLDAIAAVESLSPQPELHSEDDLAAWVDANRSAFDAVSMAARQARVNFEWTTDEAGDLMRECYHLELAQVEDRGGAFAPIDLNQLRHHETENGSVFVGRASCTAGATFGSLRNYSQFLVMNFQDDQRGVTTSDIVAESYWRFANNYRQQFYDLPFQTRLLGDKLLHWAPGEGIASVHDLTLGTFDFIREDLPSGGLLAEMQFTEDGQHVVQINTDGSFHVHRLEGGETLIHGRVVDDEVSIWDANFHFDATAEAASLIDLRFPGLYGEFSLDRFDPILYSPGLASAILTGEPITDVPHLDVPPDISGNLILEDGEIIGRLDVDRTRAASELRVYQDGVRTDVIVLEDNLSLDFRVQRLPGTRYASVLVANDDGLVSLPVTADLGVAIPGGTRRALAVGVDLYTEPRLDDLNFAKADADRLLAALSDLPDGVPAFSETRFVGGRRATPADIMDAVDELIEGLGSSDHAVLFFAGHGVRDADGEFYMALHNTDLDDLSGTALPWAEVAQRLSSIDTRVTILIDACHSGAAGGDAFATNDGAVAGFSAVPSNVTVLAASKGRQLSREVPASAEGPGGGLFSLALREVLVDDRTRHDTNANGRIEASELSAAISLLVAERSDGEQVPWMTRGRIVGDYALF